MRSEDLLAEVELLHKKVRIYHQLLRDILGTLTNEDNHNVIPEALHPHIQEWLHILEFWEEQKADKSYREANFQQAVQGLCTSVQFFDAAKDASPEERAAVGRDAWIELNNAAHKVLEAVAKLEEGETV